METTVEQSELDKFNERNNKRLARDATICNWHVALHIETGLKLPWTGTDGYVYCNQSSYDENGDYVIDEDATVKFLATVIKFAAAHGYSVQKDYNDDNFTVKVTISDNPRIVVNYIADRNTVCTAKVVDQKYVPAEVIPGKLVDVVEWECNKLSFLAIDTSDE